jgi:DNA-binding transcriptional LysR family regulator
LKRFHKKFPKIKVQLQMTDRFLDFVENDVDIAFRIGQLADGNFVAKNVGDIERIAVAHKEYLDENPAPKVVEDLQHHSCIVVGKGDVPSRWSGKTKTVSRFRSKLRALIP